MGNTVQKSRTRVSAARKSTAMELAREAATSQSGRVNLKGKVFIVTGGDHGVGFEVARALAFLNATIVIACEEESSGTDAVTFIEAEFSLPEGRCCCMEIDLADLESVKLFVEDFEKSKCGRRLDGLIHCKTYKPSLKNALEHTETSFTKQGVELTFGVNYLGPFYLTRLLLDKLHSDGLGFMAHATSEAHRETNEHAPTVLPERLTKVLNLPVGCGEKYEDVKSFLCEYPKTEGWIWSGDPLATNAKERLHGEYVNSLLFRILHISQLRHTYTGYGTRFKAVHTDNLESNLGLQHATTRDYDRLKHRNEVAAAGIVYAAAHPIARKSRAVYAKRMEEANPHELARNPILRAQLSNLTERFLEDFEKNLERRTRIAEEQKSPARPDYMTSMLPPQVGGAIVGFLRIYEGVRIARTSLKVLAFVKNAFLRPRDRVYVPYTRGGTTLPFIFKLVAACPKTQSFAKNTHLEFLFGGPETRHILDLPNARHLVSLALCPHEEFINAVKITVVSHNTPMEKLLPNLRELSLAGISVDSEPGVKQLGFLLPHLAYVPQVRCSIIVAREQQRDLFQILGGVLNLKALYLEFRNVISEDDDAIAELLKTLPNSLTELTCVVRHANGDEPRINQWNAKLRHLVEKLKALGRRSPCEVLTYGGVPDRWRMNSSRVDFSIPKDISRVWWMYPVPLNTISEKLNGDLRPHFM